LTLTLDETRSIAEINGVKLPSPAAALALHEHSAGWMMGLILVLERASSNGAGTQADLRLSLRDGQEEPVFDYFVGEVFGKLDAHCRNVLMQASLLPKMTAESLAQLIGN